MLSAVIYERWFQVGINLGLLEPVSELSN